MQLLGLTDNLMKSVHCIQYNIVIRKIASGFRKYSNKLHPITNDVARPDQNILQSPEYR